ncbi:cell division protein FtsQ [Micromonospora pattaloongensis]|uniref:Cell division protein FtsQ n=1 Tax=Micromonospora pattaloongensis TaxID=405436 RepID=A0A1H3Q2W2_9ACTN|nr:FtsQ-type POTRA domain-containing protein [Micromonospora pattaloongensis]SDZ07726.1 cell division protein FtsQ [Micromonospora pattaloongensis]
MTPARVGPGGPGGRASASGTTGPTGRGGRGGSEAHGARRWRLVRAGTDAVPPSVRRFMRRARQRRLRAAMPWAVVGGVLAFAGLVAWIVFGTAVFGVREVRVTGGQILTAVEVRNAAAVPDGVSLARVDVAAVRERVAALAPVERVTVVRDWPRTVLVQVVERTPVAVVPQRQGFVVVDAAGVPFRTLAERPAELPLARVVAPGRDDPATRAALQVLGALTPELRSQLQEVAVAGPARITVKLRGGRTIVWGDASDNETKARVAGALLSREGRTIDVSAPDVVTVR